MTYRGAEGEVGLAAVEEDVPERKALAARRLASVSSSVVLLEPEGP